MDSDMPAGMDGLLEAIDIAWTVVAAAATTVPMTGLANDSPLNKLELIIGLTPPPTFGQDKPPTFCRVGLSCSTPLRRVR